MVMGRETRGAAVTTRRPPICVMRGCGAVTEMLADTLADIGPGTGRCEGISLGMGSSRYLPMECHRGELGWRVLAWRNTPNCC